MIWLVMTSLISSITVYFISAISSSKSIFEPPTSGYGMMSLSLSNYDPFYYFTVVIDSFRKVKISFCFPQFMFSCVTISVNTFIWLLICWI